MTRSPILHGPALDPRIAALTGDTLVELLDRAVSRTPDREALVLHHTLGNDRWTYRQLGERVRSAAAVLASAGVTHGDRVVTWGPNDPWLVAAMFGAWRLGAIVVPLDLRMADGVALRIAGRTEPAVVLAASGQAEAAAGLGAPVLAIDAATLGSGGGELPVRTASREDPAEVVFTSGTSSDPKGVVLTHGQVIHNVRMLAAVSRSRHPERGLGIIPLSHMYGQIAPLFQCLIWGSTLVFVHALTPTAIGQTLRRERITAITAVPQLAQLLLDGIEAEATRRGARDRLDRGRRIARFLPFPARRRLFRSVHAALGGHLELITSGGALLTPELQTAWELFGVRVAQGYGGTECAAITAHSRTSRRPGTVGSVLAGLEVRLAEDGELLVRGPSVMAGYWRNPEATAEVLDPDGWLHTGDAARVESHGEIVILGRTRDRIALPNGLKVYPDDVEAALCATDAIRSAVVLESSPGRLGAVIVPEDPDAPDAVLAAAVKAANATLGPHQRVNAWRRWPEADLPRTHTLKVRRDPVKAWFRDAIASGRDAPPDQGPVEGPDLATGRSRRSVLARALGRGPGIAGVGAGLPDARVTATADLDPLTGVCAIAGELLADPSGTALAVTPETRVADLGLDSLGRVTLGLRLEEAFDASLTDDELAEATDLRDLAARVTAARGRPPAPEPPTWATSRAARGLRRVLDATLTRAIVDLVARPQAIGGERLAAITGPVLLCPNHTSHLDVPSVRRVLSAQRRDRTAVAAAADYFFTRPVLGTVVSLVLGAIPFGRTSDVRASLERVADLACRGWTVIIFPEGTRSPDGRLGPMRDGIGLLATATGCPVVPVHIAGAYTILPKGRTLPRRRRSGRVVVRFGAPMTFPAGTPPHEVALRLGEAIAALAQESAGG